ncbi:MAG: YdiU family protein [Pseudomonadota bacterium]
MIAFDNRFIQLPAAFWRRQLPAPLRNPRLFAVNTPLLHELNLDSAWLHSADALAGLSGHAVWPGADPVAMKYAGHQFGGWNPDLGDGRGVLLGEIIDRHGRRQDLHLKGSGPTPFSRMGDGRAVLRSSIREYLAGEALHALGVPTTRALALVSSDEPVQRERRETGATLLRIADSHIRFGHFEWLCHSQQHDLLPVLAEHVIARHYPDCAQAEKPNAALFGQIVLRTARLMADWQAVGFAHGVMNTDNFSISGQTLDFGPYAFMESYDPSLICNHSDHNGRYAWYLQPSVGFWNLNALAQAFTPLVSVADLRAALETYEPMLTAHYDTRMRHRLGLQQAEADDKLLVQAWLDLLRAANADYPIRSRSLGQRSIVAQLNTVDADWGIHAEAARAWLLRYEARVLREATDELVRQASILAAVPAYVLRNYLAEIAIKAAEAGNSEPLETLLTVLQAPFVERLEWAGYAGEAPAWGRCLSISCSS